MYRQSLLWLDYATMNHVNVPLEITIFKLAHKMWLRRITRVQGKRIAQFASFASTGTNLCIFVSLHWLCMYLLAQIISFAFGLHTPYTSMTSSCRKWKSGHHWSPVPYLSIIAIYLQIEKQSFFRIGLNRQIACESRTEFFMPKFGLWNQIVKLFLIPSCMKSSKFSS